MTVTVAKKKISTWGTSCTTVTLYNINPTRTGLVLNPSHCGDKPWTNCLNHRTAKTSVQIHICFSCCMLFKVTSPYLSCSVGQNCSLILLLTWSWNVSCRRNFIGSRCEWNWSITVSGFRSRCSENQNEGVSYSWPWSSGHQIPM
jgi:hypothetical protein